MKVWPDTWFFVQLSKEHPKAVDVLRKVAKGKDRLMDGSIDRSKYFDVIDLDVTIAKAAGKLSATYGIPTVNAIIAQTCISERCGKVLTDDNHFDTLEKNEIVEEILMVKRGKNAF